MRLNDTELETLPAAKEADLSPKPTWGEAFKASFENTMTTGRTISQHENNQNGYYDRLSELSNLDPDNKNHYHSMMANIPFEQLSLMEDAYTEKGQDWLIDAYGEDDATSFLKYYQASLDNGLGLSADIETSTNKKIADDYKKNQAIVEKGDYLTASLAAGGVAAFRDPLTQLTLPLGGPSATAKGIAALTGTAIARETAVAAAVEPMISLAEYTYKDEIGIRQSVGQTVQNTLITIGASGVFAGTTQGLTKGIYDLTAKGKAELKKADPELHGEYEALYSKNITSEEDHLDNLFRQEQGLGLKIPENPSKEMQDIMKSGPQKEYSFIEPTEPPAKKYEASEIYVGQDADGNAMTRSYKEITEELDAEEAYLKEIEDCILRGVA